ncbi:MAG: hypothetical protein ACO3RD_05905, partial [Candidatus Nanopelagicaceae bacterium]
MLRRIILFALSLSLLSLPSARAADGDFRFKRISPATVTAGEKVNWSLDWEGKSGYFLTNVSLYILGPNGETFNSSWSFQDSGLTQSTILKEKIFTLETSKKVNSGIYKIQGVVLSTFCRSCENGNYGSESYVYRRDANSLYQFGGNMKVVDLSNSDFKIEGGEITKNAAPEIESVVLSESRISPGETLKVTINANTPGYIWKFAVDLRSPSGRRYSWFGFNDNLDWSSATPATFKRNGSQWSISFDIPIDDEYSPGNYSVSRLILDWFLDGPPKFVNNTRNTTAFWGGSFDLLNDQEGLRFNGSIWSFDYTKYNLTKLVLTILDAGQGVLRDPIWTRIEWVTPESKSGNEAILEIDVDAFEYQISTICVGNFINENDGRFENIYACEPELVGSKEKYSNSNWVKKGTFRIPVYFPRSATPGTYRISYLNIVSSRCLNGLDQKCNNSENSRINLTYSYSLQEGRQPWLGYIDPSTKKVTITGKGEVQPPKLNFTNITSDSFNFTEQKSYEVDCEYA